MSLPTRTLSVWIWSCLDVVLWLVISPLTCDAEHLIFISLYLQHSLTLVFWVKYSFREMSWPKHLSASLPILTTPSHSCLHLLSVIIGPFRVGIDHSETILKTTQRKYQLTSRCPIILNWAPTKWQQSVLVELNYLVWILAPPFQSQWPQKIS